MITLRYLERQNIHPLLRAFGVQLSVLDTGREGIEGKEVPSLRLSVHSASFWSCAPIPVFCGTCSLSFCEGGSEALMKDGGGGVNGLETTNLAFRGVPGVRKAGGSTFSFCAARVSDREVAIITTSFFVAVLCVLDVDVTSDEKGGSGIDVTSPRSRPAPLALAAASSKASFASCCRILSISSSSALSLASITATFSDTRR